MKTRKPHKVRASKHKQSKLKTIKELKNKNPNLGKAKIAQIIKKTGYQISSSTVGRLLKNKD